MSTHTPGPWRWELNSSSKSVRLCGGVPKYDLTVMDFVRYGMSGAAPRFRDTNIDGFNVMHRIDNWSKTVPGREHHASWFQCINHADANLISAAPDLLEACEEFVRKVENGEAQSTRSYNQMKLAIGKARGEGQS